MLRSQWAAFSSRASAGNGTRSTLFPSPFLRLLKCSFLTGFLVLAIFAGGSVHAQSAALEELEKARTESPAPGTNFHLGRFESFVRDITVGYFNFSSVNMEQLNQTASEIFAYNYFAFDYKLSRQSKLSVRPVFEFSTAGADYKGEYQKGNFAIGDSFINYINYKAVRLPWSLEAEAQWRVYFPTSEGSSRRGMIARFRPWFLLSKRLTHRFEAIIHFEPDYYFESQAASKEPGDRVYGTKDYGADTHFELAYRVSSRLGLSAKIGDQEQWSHASPANNLNSEWHTEQLEAELSANTTLFGTFVVAGLSQQHDTIRAYRELSAFHSYETSLFILDYTRF